MPSQLCPFFCEVEAVETVIRLTEVAPKLGKRVETFWTHIEGANVQANSELLRLALKLITGADKTRLATQPDTSEWEIDESAHFLDETAWLEMAFAVERGTIALFSPLRASEPWVRHAADSLVWECVAPALTVVAPLSDRIVNVSETRGGWPPLSS